MEATTVAPDTDALYQFVRSDPELNEMYRQRAISQAPNIIQSLLDAEDKEWAPEPAKPKKRSAKTKRSAKSNVQPRTKTKLPYAEVTKLILKSMRKGGKPITVHDLGQKPLLKKLGIEAFAIRSCMYKLEKKKQCKRSKDTATASNGVPSTLWEKV